MNKEPNARQSSATSERDEPATGRVQRAADQVRSATTERVDQLKNAAESAKDNAAERVRKLGNAVRKIGEHMRIEEQMYIADRANGAAQRLDRVADYIADAELGTLLADAENIARRKPAWIYGGTFIVGLAAGRFLKSGTVASDGNAPRARRRAHDIELPAERELLAAHGEPR